MSLGILNYFYSISKGILRSPSKSEQKLKRKSYIRSIYLITLHTYILEKPKKPSSHKVFRLVIVLHKIHTHTS